MYKYIDTSKYIFKKTFVNVKFPRVFYLHYFPVRKTEKKFTNTYTTPIKLSSGENNIKSKYVKLKKNMGRSDISNRSDRQDEA